jgi:hypothetical protein
VAVVGQSLLLAGPAIAKTMTRSCSSVTVGLYRATNVRVTPKSGVRGGQQRPALLAQAGREVASQRHGLAWQAGPRDLANGVRSLSGEPLLRARQAADAKAGAKAKAKAYPDAHAGAHAGSNSRAYSNAYSDA